MKLPESVQDIADVIGEDAALKLVESLPQCGKRPWRRMLYVPKRLQPDHKLVAALGWNDAVKMVRYFGGEILQVAACQAIKREQQYARIHDMTAQGVNKKEVARREGITLRMVNWVLKEKTPVMQGGE